MGIFGTRKVHCPAGEWTTLISNFASGMPASFRVRFTPEEGRAIKGSYIEKRHWWIFPQRTVNGELTAEIVFQRYWINAIYSVKVCPETDVIAEIG